MFKNFLKVAFRNLWKNKAFSAINIVGLSVGLAVCLLIILYVKDELSYDKYNARQKIFTGLMPIFLLMEHNLLQPSVRRLWCQRLKKDYPQIVQYTRLRNFGDILVKKDNQNIQNQNAVFADSTFFQVFSIPMIAGNRLTALNEPNSIVIDETTAKKIFQLRTMLLGKTLYVDNSTSCKITGVIKDIPPQSHFHFSFIRPIHDTWHDDRE